MVVRWRGAHDASMTTTSSAAPLGFYRSSTNRRIKGVCGGFAERYGIDASIVRIGFVLLTLFLMVNITGWAMFGYVALALLVHDRPAPTPYVDVDPFGA